MNLKDNKLNRAQTTILNPAEVLEKIYVGMGNRLIYITNILLK